jgi:exonuclease III
MKRAAQGGSLAKIQQLWVYCRIDYHLATPAMAAAARSVSIYKDQKFSDHAPITVSYDWS